MATVKDKNEEEKCTDSTDKTSKSRDTISPHTKITPDITSKAQTTTSLMQEEKTDVVHIVDASVSTDIHSQLNGFDVYLIQINSLNVRRRYSEFEALRTCLVKQFPTLIVPPIPEKQSLKSNISQTTSKSLGLATSSITSNITDTVPSGQSSSNDTNSAFTEMKTFDEKKGTSNSMISLIEYRKRMLSEFLNKCLHNPVLSKSKFLSSFFNPEINYLDFVQNKENSSFFKTSIYQLSPKAPLENIENQIYLTLPIPSSSDAYLFKELSEEEQFQKFVCFESKFLKYELILNNIAKINKHLVRHTQELSTELSELGVQFNQLSILQDSNFIEKMGKLFERHTIFLSNLSSSINIGFLDKLIELKSFSSTCKGLMEYNRKKIIQFKLIEKELYNVRSRYKRYESEEQRIRDIEWKANAVMRNSSPDSDEYFEPPITVEELQTALYSKSFNQGIYGKIPGINKFNNIILKYVNDPNPDETRRTKFYNIRIRLFQLEKQYSCTQEDLNFINNEVMKQLETYHEWFKHELFQLVVCYRNIMKTYDGKGLEQWRELGEFS
ncbi:hypothetical protein CANINC_000185 [Pichia inconspicua]|uniref:PX domain-containing protein n=1 Tax=Pichia inconspicua TaxID=52247 RepID=A0A4T0X8I1_9ASCO|nr:hypothetical protein CANINC_000185 [[Candida] inconspicua]